MHAYRHLYALGRSWILVALIASGFAIVPRIRRSEGDSTETVATPTAGSGRDPLVPSINPLLQESIAVEPWECTSCDDSLVAIINVTKAVLGQHPMLLLDVVLLLVLKIPSMGKVFTNLMPRILFSPSALSWWWTRHLKSLPWSTKLVSLSRHGRKSIRSLIKAIRRLYKNRSKVSTLTDYTWYVGTSSTTKDEE